MIIWVRAASFVDSCQPGVHNININITLSARNGPINKNKIKLKIKEEFTFFSFFRSLWFLVRLGPNVISYFRKKRMICSAKYAICVRTLGLEENERFPFFPSPPPLLLRHVMHTYTTVLGFFMLIAQVNLFYAVTQNWKISLSYVHALGCPYPKAFTKDAYYVYYNNKIWWQAF